MWGTGGQLDWLQSGRSRSLVGVSVNTKTNVIEASVPLSDLPSARQLRVYAERGCGTRRLTVGWPFRLACALALHRAGVRQVPLACGCRVSQRRGAELANANRDRLRTSRRPPWPQATSAPTTTCSISSAWPSGYQSPADSPRPIGGSDLPLKRGGGSRRRGQRGRHPRPRAERLPRHLCHHFLGRAAVCAVRPCCILPIPRRRFSSLHGGTANHTSVVNEPGAEAQLGDADGRVLISPLGRGPNSQYTDEAELDPIETLDDAQRRLPIDRNRVSLAGYSMGGFGAYRIAGRYADRFSSLTLWDANSGTAGEANGDPHELLDNLRYLPIPPSQPRGRAPALPHQGALDLATAIRSLHHTYASSPTLWGSISPSRWLTTAGTPPSTPAHSREGASAARHVQALGGMGRPHDLAEADPRQPLLGQAPRAA